ncbi:MAG: hypothetical protein H8E91_05430 [Planctomycetes bacterium]|nr:hypothetical protein [Planctomycetota bacterium]
MPILLITSIRSRLRGHPPRKGVGERLGAGPQLHHQTKPILLHAVSVGEVNAIRNLVQLLAADGYNLVISVTTDTGIQRAIDLFGNTHTIVRYPLDFSWSVKNFLRRVNPTLIVLVELEVWPNMLRFAKKKHIPVVVVNGRLSHRSYKRYKLVSSLLRNTFGRISVIGMQNKSYAKKVSALGADNVRVLGTMKWDNAIIRDSVEGAKELAQNLGIDSSIPLVVAGSTTPEEHRLLLEALPKNVQLLIAPRRPEWFDDAQEVFSPCNRRTKTTRCDSRYFVLDTIGELTAAYSLATIVVIGRSFAPLHGSDPTEPIGLGKPTIVGPNMSDFPDIAKAFIDGNGIVQCNSAELKENIQRLLGDEDFCKTITANGRKVIASHQGATKKYVQLIEEAVST